MLQSVSTEVAAAMVNTSLPPMTWDSGTRSGQRAVAGACAKASGEQSTERATIEPIPNRTMRAKSALHDHHSARDLVAMDALGPLRLNRRIINTRVEHLARHAATMNSIWPAKVA